ncbi:prepilin-type N-terminal cleavage/methylation domain-containing protein [Gracilibacillus marinus]|uniref:Prepilin-type N-terminal cleavage/methylation domain-containing protein n=1 Tax=Gracilibacillus marinus TaxID=630535 RepID=A0ABV8VTC4_9BACI
MTQKFKKLLKNEKGFTLVELLAVIVILGIILAIAIPAIGNIIENSKTSATEAENELILDAARLADIDEAVGDDDEITVGELIDGGYLTDKELTSEDSRKIVKDENGNFTFE